MSKPSTRWAVTLSIGAAETALFIAWQIYGIAGAGRALMFWVWTFSVLICLACSRDVRESDVDEFPPMPVLRTVSVTKTLLLVVALVWVDCIGAGIAICVALLANESFVQRKRKLRAELERKAQAGAR